MASNKGAFLFTKGRFSGANLEGRRFLWRTFCFDGSYKTWPKSFLMKFPVGFIQQTTTWDALKKNYVNSGIYIYIYVFFFKIYTYIYMYIDSGTYSMTL